MRLRVVLAVTALAFAVAPVAHAQTLPDLPGMDAAKKAVGGRAATTSKTNTAPAPKPDAPSTPTKPAGSATNALTIDAAQSLSKLPGAGAIPSVTGLNANLSSSQSAIPGPDTLVLLAALGSFAALGALYMLRRLGRI